MIHIGKKYSIDAVFALTKAEDIWRGIEKCLYNNGKTIHFSKYGELPCIRAKQINRGISMSVKDNGLKFKLKGNVFGIQVKDRFQTDEVCAVLEYLLRSEIINDKAINKFLDKAYCIDTYRPCYATLVPKFIRGKYRVYLHLTIEGKAKPKYDRFGNPRHKFGKGIIGADIGTQTVAYTSNTEVGLKIFQSVVTVFRLLKEENACFTVRWTGQDVQLIRKTIMMMVLLKKAAKLGNILIIIKS